MSELYTPRRPRVDQCNIILINQCNIRCVACSYWKIKEQRHVRLETLVRLVPELKRYQVHTVMLTGGEPTMHPEFGAVVDLFHREGFNITLVNNGSHFQQVLPAIKHKLTRFILSLDADNAPLYSQIRGWDGFDELVQVPARLKEESPETDVTVCLLIQKKNYRRLPAFLRMAMKLPIDRVSFLVPDLLGFLYPQHRGGSFGHRQPMPDGAINAITLSLEDIEIFRREVIPEVQAVIAERPEYNNVTVELLPAYAEYFERFHRREKRREKRRCGLPFREIVLTEDEELKFCFFTPFQWKYEEGMDPVNNDRMVDLRRKYLETDEYLDDYCDMCLQAIRRE